MKAQEILADLETMPHHNCGLVGTIREEPTRQTLGLSLVGVKWLQHRGQEAAGVAQVVDEKIVVHKDIGRIDQALPQELIHDLPETVAAIFHTRYSTAGTPEVKNAQPYLFKIKNKNGETEFALAHNGNVIWEKPPHDGEPTSDSFGIGKAIAEGSGTFEENAIHIFLKLNGAYVLFFLTPEAIYVARDPWGFRPCVLGRFEDGVRGMTAASETVALNKMKAKIEGRVGRGQFVKLTAKGTELIWEDPRVKEFNAAACTFETPYFAHVSSEPDVPGYEDQTNHQIRKALGRRLAKRVVPFGDLVIPVPNSGNSYSIGVSQESGIPFDLGVFPNSYAGRSFITPDTLAGHMQKAEEKYAFDPNSIRDKAIVLVDDSIVRGPTMRGIIMNLFELGAKNITLLIGVPPIKHPCFWGIDFADPNELIYNRLKWDKDSSFEEAFRRWLVGDNQLYLKRLRVHFQKLEDYVEITRNVAFGTALTESGGCFHCVSGVCPEGALIDAKMQKGRFETS